MTEKFKVIENNNANTCLRVATFNIGDFSTYGNSSGDGIASGNGTDTTKEQYRAVFERVGADVWGLQEDSPYFNGTTKELPFDAIYGNSLPYYERNFTGTYNGKAFLSRYELYGVEAVKYPTVKTSYAPDGTPYYGHPWFLTGKITVGGKEITLISLHFDWNCKERRAQQITSVIEYAKSREYCIIIGDFNPQDYINGKVQVEGNNNIYQGEWKRFADAGFDTANGGRFGTFGTIMSGGSLRQPDPWDSIFVTPNIKILNAEPIYESWMTDHAIVVADLEIN